MADSGRKTLAQLIEEKLLAGLKEEIEESPERSLDDDEEVIEPFIEPRDPTEEPAESGLEVAVELETPRVEHRSSAALEAIRGKWEGERQKLQAEEREMQALLGDDLIESLSEIDQMVMTPRPDPDHREWIEVQNNRRAIRLLCRVIEKLVP